jgi:hypothetical protein
MPWLTSVVYKQGPGEPLTRLPRFGDGPKNITFRHIVYVYHDKVNQANNDILPISFNTLAQAGSYAAPDYPVSVVIVTHREDAHLIPERFVAAPTLGRFVTDVARFAHPRPLPLLFDILRAGASVPTSSEPDPRESGCIEFIVMTNSDIHVQPTFYRVLAALIQQGYDVITVNRRTIDADSADRTYSPILMAERGKDHKGFDCFVFPSRMLEDFVKNESCCGTGGVARSLLFNLVAHARRFLMLTQAQMTFHLGDDRYWSDAKFRDYIEFNLAQAQSVISALASDPEKAKRLRDFISSMHQAGHYANWYTVGGQLRRRISKLLLSWTGKLSGH